MFAEWRSKMTTYKVQKCNPLKNMYTFYQLTDVRFLRPLCAITVLDERPHYRLGPCITKTTTARIRKHGNLRKTNIIQAIFLFRLFFTSFTLTFKKWTIAFKVLKL